MERKYDFAGWATYNDVRCSDGKTIRRDAFKDDDGRKVPLVWMHSHNDVENVLGHAILENCPEGVYAYGYFNDTVRAQHAKQMLLHGDITGLSIWANNLIQTKRKDVLHGTIRELSLVLSGANPKAGIEEIISHSNDNSEEEIVEGIVFIGEQEFDLLHSEDLEDNKEENKEDKEDSKEKTENKNKKEEDPSDTVSNAESDDNETVQDIFDSMSDEQKECAYYLIGMAANGEDPEDITADETVEHANTDGKTIDDILNSMTEKQQNVVYYMVGEAMKEFESENSKTKDTKGGNNEMKHNVFDKETDTKENVLSHSEIETIVKDAKRMGSMKESFLAHAEEYGIENLEFLFPEARTMTNQPQFIQRDMGWVAKVMSGVHKSPFSRIKSVFADITEDEARAKGYIKGNLKKEEVFSLLKRTTTPTTIYKKQKMDRDDVVDITDFDVITWLKAEMRMMLDEEIARAILIGDGRLASSDDKINEQNIRPISKDEDLYTVKVKVQVKSAATSDDKAKAFIRAVIKSRKQYKGSGNPTLYTTEDMVTDCLLLTDEMGRDLYDSVEKLKTKLRVKEIVTVEPMEEAKGAEDKPLLGILTNLVDYNVGADKGGSINMFDDFDIDYNQMKYLIETRCSGALVKPFSAIAFTLDVQG